MASQTQTSLQPEQFIKGLLVAETTDEREELAFYEGTLRGAEDDAGLTLRGLDVKPGCKIGDNFSSIVTRNTAFGARGDGSAYSRSVIVKRAPHTDRFRCLAAFSKETDAYSSLVPVMEAVCRRAGLALPLARCLHASQHLRPDLIVLEDLADLGYSMRPRQQGLDRDHASLVMRALGRFHGSSLALRRLRPRVFDRLRAATAELIFFPAAREVFARSLDASATLAALSLRRSGRDDLARRLTERVAARGGVFDEMCDVVRPPPDDGHVPPVFTHGDCWANNLLFRYEAGGRPCETRLVDLAGIRCASPALDILHFMYTSLPRNVRREHRDQLLQQYVSALRDTVANVTKAGQGSDITGGTSRTEVDVPSVDELRAELRQRASFGLWMGLWMLPAIFFSPDIIPVLETSDDCFSERSQAAMCQVLPEQFHQRVLDLVEEHADDGLL